MRKSHKAVDLSDLIGKRFEMAANGPDAYDCYNLCKEVLRRAGYELPEKKCIYDLAARSKALIDAKKMCIRLDKPKKYCIVSFSFQRGLVTHIGVMVDRKRFIHTRENTSVCIESLERPYWGKNVEGFYEFVGS